MQRKKIALWALIGALALVFGSFGMGKLLSPLVWIGWIPSWMEGFLGMTKDVWLRIIGIEEIMLAVLLIVPIRRVRQAASFLMILHLTAVLTQTGFSNIAVRDAGLLLSALGLFLLL